MTSLFLGGGDLDIHNVFLVPQQPYNVLGSLADMISYPDVADVTDMTVAARLTEVLLWRH